MASDDRPRVRYWHVLRKLNWSSARRWALPVLTAFGILSTALFSYAALKHTIYKSKTEEYKENAKANIYLRSSPAKDCFISMKGKYSDGCALDVFPTDTEKQILSFRVQYPANSGTLGLGTFGGASVSVGEVSKYLSDRAIGILDLPKGDDIRTAFVPIIIYTTYELGGLEYKDRSMYFMFYEVANVGDVSAVRPTLISFCGRLKPSDPDVDFLLDSWVVSEVGYADRTSHALSFDCAENKVMWIRAQAGKYNTKTEVYDRAQKRKYKKGEPIPMVDPSVYIRSSTDKSIKMKTWFADPR